MIDFKALMANIGDLVKYGSQGGKDAALEEQDRQKKAQDEATKKMNDESNKAEKEKAVEEKKLTDYYQNLKKEELDKIKLEKQKLSLLQQVQKLFGKGEDGTPAQIPQEIVQKILSPTPTRATETTPTDTPNQEEFLLDYAPYIEDQSKIDAYYPNGIPQPSKEMLDIIRQVSPNDATRSGILKLTESGYNMNPADYTGNSNGTTDRGTNMINSGTFDWLKGTPYDEMMQKSGIENYGDMFDPLKNENMMDVIRKVQGYKAWYGPRDKGFKHGL